MTRSREDRGIDPRLAGVLAMLVHVGFYYGADAIDPPPPPPDIIEFEIAEALPEKEPEKEPEPEPKKPDPEPEPEPETKIEPPKPDLKPPPKSKKPPPPQSEPPPAAPPKQRFTLPPGSVVPGAGAGGVQVNPGEGPQPTSGSNAPPSSVPPTTKPGKGNGNGNGNGDGPGKGPGWQPSSELNIERRPRVVRVPEVECPAASERQISGTVVLLVQVQRDGKVRSAKPTKQMGYGCDEIAKKALLGAKFSPAIDKDGKPADYELRYEYVFEIQN